VAVFQRRDGSAERTVTGTDAAGVPLRQDTLFPLGSNGKLPIGLFVLRLVDAGLVRLDDPIQKYVSDAAQGNRAVTIQRLMTHTAGLPLDIPATVLEYGPGVERAALMRACAATPLQNEPGTIVQYSGTGFGLLATVIERVTGEPLWPVIKREVLSKLGVDAFPASELPSGRAATVADIRSVHKDTPYEPVNGEAWRQLALPWAGLFGTADALLSLAKAYGDAVSIVSAELLARARTDQNAGLPGGFNTTEPRLGYIDSRPLVWPQCAWGLCVEVRGAKTPHWTPGSVSRASYGHLGSTGCLVWCDPEHGAAWAVAGPQTTDNGWLLRYGPQIGTHALRPPADPARATTG
jgi:beta-lactamase class C